MARQAHGSIEVKIKIWETETDPGVAGSAPLPLPHEMTYSKKWTSGYADSTQIDRVWSSNAGVAASPGTSIDLVSASGLPSRLDSADNVQFAGGVVVLAIKHNATTGDIGNIEVGGGSAAWPGPVKDASDVIVVPPGGLLLWVAPEGVAPTATTADILKVLHAGTGTVAAESLIAGRSQ